LQSEKIKKGAKGAKGTQNQLGVPAVERSMCERDRS